MVILIWLYFGMKQSDNSYNFSKFIPMSMNTRDFRLYHYEFRRPRLTNPTYNSNGVYDSLSMLVNTRNNHPSLQQSVVLQKMTNPYDRGQPFTLGNYKSSFKPQMSMNNHSADYSSLKMAKDPTWLHEKDNQYMRLISQSRKNVNEVNVSRGREMNPEMRYESARGNEMSQQKQVQHFQSNTK